MSGLMRPKWDRPWGDSTYGFHTIQKALADPPSVTPNVAPIQRFHTIAEILARGSTKSEWIIDGLVERTAITTLLAKIKIGKSSLMLSGTKAILTGGYFLGKPVIAGHVVVVTEMAGSAFNAGLERAGLLTCEGLSVMQPHDTFGLNWPQIVAAAVAQCRRVNAVLLIVDTLNFFARTDDENSASEMHKAMRPLQAAAGSGFAIWLAQHERKSGGDLADAARGSSAVGGAVDILMGLRKPEGNHREGSIRKIETLSRFPDSPSGLVIDWPTSGDYVVLGNSDAVAYDRATQRIQQALPMDEALAKTVLVLQEESGESRTTIQRVLKELSAIRVGTGERGDSFRYYRNGPRIVM
jgi:AAA domain